jgi:shikimate kinase
VSATAGLVPAVSLGGAGAWRGERCPSRPRRERLAGRATRLQSRVALHRDNLFLIGMMGAGKTTLGRQLARRLGKRFVDADHELEARLGVPIPAIFEIEGEQGFRDREEAMIADLVATTGMVLSTGGGVVSREASRLRLRDSGTVIYLHAQPETLWLRVRHARHRPMLHTSNPRGRLAELYALRDPLYRQTAHYVVESERDAVMRLVRRLATEAMDAQDEAEGEPGPARPAGSHRGAPDDDPRPAEAVEDGPANVRDEAQR